MSTRGEGKSRKYGKIIAIILIALVVITIAVIGIRLVIESHHEVTDSRPIVKVEVPQTRNVYVYTEQIGTVQPGETVNVVPMMAGEILEVNFNPGDKVREGDVLVVIKADALNTLKIALDASEIQLNDAMTNLERTKALYETGAVSKAMMEQAQSAADGARLSYESSKTQYDMQKDYAYIKAPISGTIQYKNAEVHSFASQGNPVASILGSGKASVTFGISEDSMNSIKEGDRIFVSKSGYEGYGTITEINSMVGQNGLYNVKAELDDAGDLTANSRVIVQVVKNKAEGVMTVPLKAVYHDGGESFVYVLKDDSTLEKRNFLAGIDDGNYIAVEGGLTEKDNVITSWSREIYNGAEVTVNYDGQ